MLALPVERLLGNGGHTRRPATAISPDSSASDSSSEGQRPLSPLPAYSNIELVVRNHRENHKVKRESDSDGSVRIKEEDSSPVKTEREDEEEHNEERPAAESELSSRDFGGQRTSRTIDFERRGKGQEERPPSTDSAPSPALSPMIFTQRQLKFSIDDILRPDFGRVAISHLSPTKRHRKSSDLPDLRENSVRRPSSVKNHSEDSNSSCASSRNNEVVDESKVNPTVPAGPLLWPAWVYCTRYSDRPSSGPRSRRIRKKEDTVKLPAEQPEEKRPRTAFTAEQLGKLKEEFDENRYLTEKRRQDLARDLKLHENQIKIWFQNKRAKLKKSGGTRGGLALQLMAQGLYNHSTVPIDEDEDLMI